MFVTTQQFKKIKYLTTVFYFWRKRFALAQINQVAASLAYTTVLAIVPMLSIATILIGQLPQFIDLREAIQGWLSATLIPGVMSQKVTTYILEFSDHSKGLTLFGLLGLLITAFLTLMTIEKSFNQVWQVKEKRSFLKKVIFYTVVTAFGPIFLGVSIYLTSLIMTATQSLGYGLSQHLNFLDVIYPFLLTCLPFVMLYRFGPNVQVNTKDALMGGVFAALMFEMTKYGFTIFISQVPLYKTLYGAFAIGPLFLVWIYLTWWVTLAGAVLTASLPQIRTHFFSPTHSSF